MANPWIRTVYTCAHCKKDRGVSNHWMIVVHNETERRILIVTEWDDRTALADNAMPICGSECLLRMVHMLIPLKAGAAGA